MKLCEVGISERPRDCKGLERGLDAFQVAVDVLREILRGIAQPLLVLLAVLRSKTCQKITGEQQGREDDGKRKEDQVNLQRENRQRTDPLRGHKTTKLGEYRNR